MKRRWLIACLLILAGAFALRLYLALRYPNDAPDDGRVYAQIARNILEQGVYSPETSAPYEPTLIRLPGYPLFIAAVYRLCGHGNNTAVRSAQAALETLTCALTGLLAFLWEPREERRWRTALLAVLLAASCPFTSIYVTTILTETCAVFLTTAAAVAASYAFKARQRTRALWWWAATGALCGAVTSFRPDGGLLAAAIGLTLALGLVWRCGKGGRAQTRASALWRRMSPALARGVVFSLAFACVLAPWTVRNARVFHLFQPIAPSNADMPGEFVPRGYNTWARTWIDDNRYVEPILWRLDSRPITIEQIPARAFDSDEERARVAALLESYNHPPPDAADAQDEDSKKQDAQTSPDLSTAQEESDDASSVDDGTDDNESGQEQVSVQMTPEIDAGFAAIARERIARAPLRYYLWLPLKRAVALWFDIHAQYWPFDGELFPLAALDTNLRQQYWLPLFAFLNCAYTAFALIGGWMLWRGDKDGESRGWLALAFLIIALRMAFLSSMENPEPRYTVELYPLLLVLSALALSGIKLRVKKFPRLPLIVC